MVSHRQWWFTVLYYGIFAVTFVGISLLAYNDRSVRDFAGYISGAVGGAAFTLFLMIVWRAWLGRGSLVSQRRLRLLSPAGIPFYLFNLMVSYGTAAVEAQQPMSDPKRRNRRYIQREQFRDTLAAMEQ